MESDLGYAATNYTSGYMSSWFSGRRVPDICGLCGTRPTAGYIILPVQKGAYLEKANGWGAFSGTFAAAPMVACVCALLKKADPSLTPADIKNLLNFTARGITMGVNAHNEEACPGPDKANGLSNRLRSCRQSHQGAI
ncbi:MAG: S8 family serine peptidase [Desulfatitalea sp.]|nr:S8 family serine peptidase [Desulfatitalea sp.]NNK00918.1 S8 family serine peptidase [Desulfatitalea sp.]